MKDIYQLEKTISTKDLDVIQTKESNKNTVSICKHKVTGKIIIHRHASRGKINNFIENYEFIDKNYNSTLRPLDMEKAKEIMDRLEDGTPYSSIYIFYEDVSMVTEEVMPE